MKRDLKINFSILEETIREIKKYRSALEEMERAASNMIGQLEKSTSKTVDELGKIYREFTAELKKCYTELEDLDIILSGYTHEMQAIIRPVNKGKFMRVDRNDIYFNKQAIIAACQEIKLLRLKYGMGLTSGWGFGRTEEEKAREEQNYRKLERIWQEVIPRYARKLDGQIDALNRIYNGKIIPFENKDDEYRAKADRLYGKYTNPWERIRTRSISEIKLRTDLLRGIAAAIIDLVKGVYGLGKGVVCYAASGAVLAVTYPFSQRPRWAEENIKETNGAVSGILKDPMLLVEAFSQQVTDAYEEEGAGYCIGYAAGDFLGAKGLDKLAKLGKVKLPEKSIPKEIGNTAADTGKILEKVEAPPVRRVTKAVDEAAVTEIGKGIEGTSNTTYKYGIKDVLASEKGGIGGSGFLTPKQMNQFKAMVQEGTDIEFATKDQVMNFIKNKFGDFPEEVAGSRSAQGWHFDSHPINGSADAIEHINLYSKDQGFRVHITWRK